MAMVKVHDLMYSPTGREPGDILNIDVPENDPDFPPKTKLEFWRTARVNGTGNANLLLLLLLLLRPCA